MTPEEQFVQTTLRSAFVGQGTVAGTVDHLNKTLDFGNWSTEVRIGADATAIVVHLGLRSPSGVWVWQDGVADLGDGPLNLAYDRAFLQAAYLHGIPVSSGQAVAPTQPVQTATPAAPSPQPVVAPQPSPAPVQGEFAPPQVCPVHGIPFVMQPGGVSKKTGKPYNGFWKCNGKNPDGSYCQQKPA